MVLFIASQMASTLVMSVTADKTQQRIMLLLPLVFAAFIPNFPAGLIVYWITTNFWTLGQQLVVRKLSPPPAAVGAPGPAVALADGGTAPPAKKPPPPPRRKKRRRR
jgi:YidC/Oxa1 family membrane protein insertase